MSRISILATAIVLALTAICVAAPKPAAKRVVTVTEKNTTASLRVGDTLIVRLESIPGTGYGWKTASVNTKLLKQMGEPVLEEAAKPMPGAVQHQVFKFKAIAAGKTNMELHYVRSWEKNKPPAKAYELAVTVTKPSKPHKK